MRTPKKPTFGEPVFPLMENHPKTGCVGANPNQEHDGSIVAIPQCSATRPTVIN